MATKAQTPESHEMLSAEERLARKEEVERVCVFLESLPVNMKSMSMIVWVWLK